MSITVVCDGCGKWIVSPCLSDGWQSRRVRDTKKRLDACSSRCQRDLDERFGIDTLPPSQRGLCSYHWNELHSEVNDDGN